MGIGATLCKEGAGAFFVRGFGETQYLPKANYYDEKACQSLTGKKPVGTGGSVCAS